MADRTATYKGKTYRVKFIGETKFGRRANLEFMDGSKNFWVDASLVSVTGADATGERRCSKCHCRESSLRRPYEKMLMTRNYGVICSPCYSDEKAGHSDD